MGGQLLWGAQMEMYTSFRSRDLVTQCLLALCSIGPFIIIERSLAKGLYTTDWRFGLKSFMKVG